MALYSDVRQEQLRNRLATLKVTYYVKLTHIANEADISQSHLVLFLQGNKGISDEVMDRLEKVVSKYENIQL